jgi:hypothetical protein
MKLDLYQSRKSTVRQIISLLVVGISAVYLLYSYQTSGWTYDIVFGVFFSLWALYILWVALTKRLLFRETSNGFVARGPFRYHTIQWDQLVAVGDRDISVRILLLVWKRKPDEKEKFLPLSKKSLDAENLERIFELIMKNRPDLPTYSRGEINSLGK